MLVFKLQTKGNFKKPKPLVKFKGVKFLPITDSSEFLFVHAEKLSVEETIEFISILEIAGYKESNFEEIANLNNEKISTSQYWKLIEVTHDTKKITVFELMPDTKTSIALPYVCYSFHTLSSCLINSIINPNGYSITSTENKAGRMKLKLEQIHNLIPINKGEYLKYLDCSNTINRAYNEIDKLN